MTERKDKTFSPGSCDRVPEDDREATSGTSCDWAPGGPSPGGDDRSGLRKFTDYRWDGVEPERYKAEDGGWAAIARQVLIAGNPGAGFDVRYFEIAPGGRSSLEKHAHAHVVIGVRGRGQVLLGGELRDIGFLDIAFTAPEDPHQLLNPFEEPFGFICLVDHERDRPRPLDETELIRLTAGRAGQKLRR